MPRVDPHSDPLTQPVLRLGRWRQRVTHQVFTASSRIMPGYPANDRADLDQETDTELVQWAQAMSADAFRKIWEFPGDAIYDDL